MSKKLSKSNATHSKHSNYTLPDMVKLESNPVEFKKATEQKYEFIGLPGHMPKQIRDIANKHFDNSDLIIAKVKWNKDHWTLESMMLSNIRTSEVKVEPLKATVIPFKFDLQQDFGFKFLEIDGEPSFPYRKKSIETCIARVNALDIHHTDIIEFESNGEKRNWKKAALLQELNAILDDTEKILQDSNGTQILKIKKDGMKIEMTVSELETLLNKNKKANGIKEFKD